MRPDRDASPIDGFAARPPRRWRPDAVTALTVYLALLILLPARLVVGDIGAAGTPANLFALGLVAWWTATRAVPGLARQGRQPVRTALLVWLLVWAAAYANAWGRGLPLVEANAADRWLLLAAAWGGVLLVAADGIDSWARLEALLRRLTGLGAVMAAVGTLQFHLSLDLTTYLVRLPVLTLNADLIGIRERGGPGFNRVAATAGHAIEFGVVLGVLLPLAVHLALHGRDRRDRQLRWFVVLVMAQAIPYAVSRSGFLAIAVAGFVLWKAWTGRWRIQALLVAAFGAVAVRVMVPGLLGTVRSLFTNVGSDTSISGRTEDYGNIWRYVRSDWLLGRGPGTFNPDDYILLDNEVLNLLVTTGVLGLAAFTALWATALVLARRLVKRGAGDRTRHLGVVLSAGIGTSGLTLFVFDGLSFNIFAGVLFVLMGLAGAAWRLDRDDPAAGPDRPDRPVLREGLRARPTPSAAGAPAGVADVRPERVPAGVSR